MGQKQEIAKFKEKDYSLLDSGGFEKLERFGGMTVVRPEPLAIWEKGDPSGYGRADISYRPGGKDGKEGDWITKKSLDRWQMGYDGLKFRLRLTAFKHVGIFPEQAANWEWIKSVLKPGMKVLNLFGYTGGATLAAASVGAEVTHVDSSRPSVEWAKENAELSGLGHMPIRYLVDDAMKFVAREVRRKNSYDLIMLDPPAFGHGPKGEIWKFERDLPELLSQLSDLMPKKSGNLLLNAYSLGFPGQSVEQLVRTAMPFAKDIETVDICLQETGERGFVLPTGIAVRARW